jgi:hypothetical protein
MPQRVDSTSIRTTESALNDFHNVGLGAADIQCAIDMLNPLGLACAERGKRRNGAD